MMTVTEIRIDALANGGDGIGRIEGKTCFVPYTVPGDIIDIEITETKKNYSRGRTARLRSPSPHRAGPFCPLYGECGGCNWQHIDYQYQLEAKRELLSSTLAKIGGISLPAPAVPPVVPSPRDKGYRNSAYFHVDREGGIGFYRGGSHSVVPLESCPLLVPELNRRLKELRSIVPAQGTAARPRSIHLYASETGELKEWMEHAGKTKDLPFHQINHGVNRLMVEKTAEIVRETAEAGACRVLDLFCGDGNLSLRCGCENIAGVETNGRALRKAAKQADARGLTGARYIREDAAVFLRNTKYGGLREEGFSHIIVDPPRNGVKGIVDDIAALRAPVIIYISCSPPDLARDLQGFRDAGYEPRELYPLDMFPHTSHIETAAVLKKV